MTDYYGGIPEWLTNEFLKDMLIKNEDSLENVKILSHQIESGWIKGRNYLTSILKLNMEYNDVRNKESILKMNLIMKIPLTFGPLKALSKSGIFEKEFGAYNELFPKLTEIMQTEKGFVDIIPKFLKSEKDCDFVLILEDLTFNEYKSVNPKEQLDFEHGVLVLKNISKFHAASLVLRERKPEIVERYGREHCYVKDMDPDLKVLVEPLIGEQKIEMICQEFMKWPETKQYVKFLSNLKPHIWDVYIDAISTSDGELSVINHGDLWASNILFKYDNQQKPILVKIVDFQMIKSTSPALDLLHFLFTSVQYDVMMTHYDDFVKIYLENLNLYLLMYGSEVQLKKEDFIKSLEKRELYSLVQCINVLPYVFGEYDEDDDVIPMDKFIANEKYRKLCAKHLENFSKKLWYKNYQ